MRELLTIKDACKWASHYIGKNVTQANISYLIQYGRIHKNSENGTVYISKDDLKQYYSSHLEARKDKWLQKFGDELNWRLSFSEYKEAETTKHIHRLHPYKGKFIPQLVEYFLDQHTDKFKTRAFFSPQDIILDPFCGSGTTLVQANELNLHAIGIDISEFNTFIANIKIGKYDIQDIKNTAYSITQNFIKFQKNRNNSKFENELLNELKKFNGQYFPSPEFKYDIRQGNIDEKNYGKEKNSKFLEIYYHLIKKYKIPLRQKSDHLFIDKWLLQTIRDKIYFLFQEIQLIKDNNTKKLLALVLSRTIRSCRATTHADLGTLKNPITETYYCKKHGKICKPLFSALSWWKRYTQDSMTRIMQFSKLRTNTFQQCLSWR